MGPSGCGKTTLLRCIVGRLSVDKGHLLVLSEKPGWPGHGVPGKLVGYMPQVICETNLSTHVAVRVILVSLLCFLSSGGQKRRVSFAVALLHEPELLILDEPTVGVDPILRERIWEHLISIARQGGSETTIIITTHYIEEARKADMSLEAIFLKLCHSDMDEDDVETLESSAYVPKISSQSLNAYDQGETTPLLAQNSLHTNTEDSLSNSDNSYNNSVHVLHACRCPCSLPAPRNIFAQVVKNLTLMKRNIGFLLFEFILPSIQIILFCLCIGRDPYDLHVAIVNNETTGLQLGKLFINSLDNVTINKSNPYVCFSPFFMDALAHSSCLLILPGVSNQTIDGSSVKLYLDMTNQQISVILQEKIMTGFQDFAEKLLNLVGLNPGLASLPIVIEDPIYGSKNPSFTNFMAPGIILSITFFLATGLTTLSFVMEKKEGLLDRSLVAGMTTFEIMLAHVCTQFLVMVVQVALLLIFALLVFHVPYKGPLIWVIILVLLQGFCGMTLGWGIEYLAVWRGYLVTIGWSFGLLAIAGFILRVKQ
ncbi:hypothetical protein KUTeg_006008 [Tegillarca granosa]|uniref:AAA+ ATPase domain-containing protein n=1 Tax=Tegillarca granosa TaxID=220873 RepID=A0ABQ9FFB4_TEGGR|nr:hypothetical protein KUTeg_006008 [Tegillarca granosa]